MRKIDLILIILALVMLSGCSSSSSSSLETNPDGTLIFGKGNYKFTMRDSTDKKMAEGDLVVTDSKGLNVSGTYTFTKKYASSWPGMETMDGKFAGSLSEDKKYVNINTNPMIADANVYVSLTSGKYSFYGNWSYSTMRGVGGKGRITVDPVN